MRLNGQSFTCKKTSKSNSVSFFMFFGNIFFIIICKISLFVIAANREAMLLVTYEVRRRSKVNGTGYPMFEQPIKTWEKRYNCLSTVVYTKTRY